MTKFEMTKEQVFAAIEEAQDRIYSDICDSLRNNQFVTKQEIREETACVLQGVYSALMVISKNWSQVVYWLDEAEKKYLDSYLNPED